MALESVQLAPPRLQAPRRWLSICADDAHARASPRARQVLLRHRPRLSRALRASARPRRYRRAMRPTSSGCSSGAPPSGRRDPLRRWHLVVGGVTPDVPSGYNGVVSVDLARSTACSRWTPSRAAAHPGRHARPAAGGAARPARLHAAPLSPVVRALHARRLDRHPRLRPLRHRLDPHRGPRRVRPRDHSSRCLGVTAAARLGRRHQPRPHARRFEGTLGVVTQAWMRVQPRPTHRSSAGVRFARFPDGAECVHAISQSGLHRPTAV